MPFDPAEIAATLPAPPEAARPEDELRAAHEFHGLHIGRYAVLRKLGEGGMGAVFVAYDEQLDRRVAIKLLHETAAEDDHARRRFLREAQALARLAHPNVVSLYEAGVFGGRVYLAMELVDGVPLDEWQAAKERTQDEIVAIYAQAARGLGAAHAAGIVHRDFKPANVIVGRDGRARILDFGIAWAERGGAEQESASFVPGKTVGDARLTETGGLLGTPAYMSPEQILSEPVDARSDQWSFCVALFEALYRRRPFGDDFKTLFSNVLAGRVEPPPEREIHSPRLHAALLRGMARNRDQRFPSMTALLEVLEQDPSTDPAAQGRARLVFGVVVALMCLVWSLRRVNSEMPSNARLLRLSLSVLAAFAAGAIFFRRSLWPNRFHRTMMAGLGVNILASVANRVIGFVHDQPPEAVLTRDILMLAAGTSMFALLGPTRSLFAWTPAAFSYLGLVGLSLWSTPLRVLDTSLIAVNGAMLAFLFVWADASRSVRRDNLDSMRERDTPRPRRSSQ